MQTVFIQCTRLEMADNDRPQAITVLGAGPAGLAIAAELAERGQRVTLRAPAPRAPWAASYGAFEPLLPSELQSVVSFRFPRPSWIDRTGRVSELDVSYVRLDTERLQALLLARAERAGVHLEVGAGRNDADGLTIAATGRSPESGSSTQYQTAYGVWALLSADWLEPGGMIFMDLGGSEASGPPSFLYATREGKLHFLQETVLVSDARPSFAELEHRLRRRLQSRGLALGPIEREERCLIAMGGPPRPGRGPVVHFGATAGLTHPATGYHLAHCLRLAPLLAETIARAQGESPLRLAKRARKTLWSSERKLRYRLFDYGAHILARLDQDGLGRFMENFLTQGGDALASFVDGGLSVPRTLALMGRTFRHADPDIRRRLLGLTAQNPSQREISPTSQRTHS